MDFFQFLSFLPAALPLEAWFAPILAFAALAVAAIVDARTGRVPDAVLAVAFLFVLVASAAHEEGGGVALRFFAATLALGALWLMNEIFCRLYGRDAFGMGDAKWTALAVFAFGLRAAFWSWVAGAWLALLWMGLRGLLGLVWPRLKGAGWVHFTPFLLAGLTLFLFLSGR